MRRQFRTTTTISGFTLVELLTVLIVTAIILTLAAPSFRDAGAKSALKTTAMDLVAAINNSRAQAVNLGTVATLGATDGASWSNGWNMSMPAPHDTENQDFDPKANVTVTTTGGETFLDFRRDGTTSAQVTFRICHNHLTGETGREIAINRLGRTTNQEYTCP
ncbi:GspH/FimT family pseudopilin [Alcanivorax sediminis]|nr:GspH/FimT family pseudopilin [Alcanivorax sediminis]